MEAQGQLLVDGQDRLGVAKHGNAVAPNSKPDRFVSQKTQRYKCFARQLHSSEQGGIPGCPRAPVPQINTLEQSKRPQLHHIS